MMGNSSQELMPSENTDFGGKLSSESSGHFVEKRLGSFEILLSSISTDTDQGHPGFTLAGWDIHGFPDDLQGLHVGSITILERITG